MDLKKFNVISITDDTNYDSNHCSNGGSYSFTTIFRRISPSKWQYEKSTSADFTYCWKCGDFGHSGENCYLNDEDCVVNTEDVLKDVNSIKNPYIEEKGDILKIHYKEEDVYGPFDSVSALMEALNS